MYLLDAADLVRTLYTGMLDPRKHSRGHKRAGNFQNGCTKLTKGAEPYQL